MASTPEIAPFIEELTDPRLGRLPEFDARSLNYPMRELVSTKKRIYSKEWKIRQRLNQGNTPRCVGYSIAMEIGMQPYYHNVTEYLANIIYSEAQKIDYWPGEAYAGTSNLAGMLIAQKLGFVPEFRWALKPNPLEDILLCITHIGPVNMGTNWYSGMYTPDTDGVVHITGTNQGGHAWTISQNDWQKKRVYSANSWGDAGFWLSYDDLERLIYEDGDAVIPTKRD